MAACPATPNCVSSLAQDRERTVEPLTLSGNVAGDWRRLRQIVEGIPRTHIRVDEPDYLAVECASRLFGFVDDLELRLDDGANVIHVRSASRVGRSDLGVNRRRVERIRELFESR